MKIYRREKTLLLNLYCKDLGGLQISLKENSLLETLYGDGERPPYVGGVDMRHNSSCEWGLTGRSMGFDLGMTRSIVSKIDMSITSTSDIVLALYVLVPSFTNCWLNSGAWEGGFRIPSWVTAIGFRNDPSSFVNNKLNRQLKIQN